MIKRTVLSSLFLSALISVNAQDIDFSQLNRECNEGDLDSCFLAGTLYIEGDGTDKDVFSGVKLTEKACEGGVIQACSVLGEMYLSGNGVPQNSSQAVYYIDKACNGSDMYACAVLGSMRARGIGIGRD